MNKETLQPIATPKSGPPYAHEKTHAFLKAAIAERAFFIPDADVISSKRRNILAREHNILGSYYMSDASLEEIGIIYGSSIDRGKITRQAVSHAIKGGMRRVWDSCSETLQQAFPWEELPLGKPRSLRSRMKSSIARGGNSVKVARAIQQGQDSKELMQEVKVQPKTRRVVRTWGFDVDPLYHNLTGEIKRHLVESLRKAETPNEVRELFDRVNSGFYNSETRGENAILTRLEDLIVKLGFKARNDRNKYLFIAALERASIVVGKYECEVAKGAQAGKVHRYYFIRSQETEVAKTVLLSDLSLQKFKL